MNSAAHDYFDALFSASLRVIGQVPLTHIPARVTFIINELKPAVLTSASLVEMKEPDASAMATILAGVRNPTAVGLNTIGLLLDRLSILAVKHWNLAVRGGSPTRAALLRSGPAREIIDALAAARPGLSSYNSKLTVHDQTRSPGSFCAAYQGLLACNLLLWEAQEILYNRNLQEIPDSELRDYLTFFSTENLSRNAYMEAADRLFWAAVEPA